MTASPGGPGRPTGRPGASAPERRRNPWWIPPWLGRVPAEIDPPRVRLLGAIALAALFENYDQAMLTQALKQIAESFALPEARIGSLLGLVRLGALPAFLLVPLADRIGRRRLFLISMVGMSVGTVLSGLAATPEQFVAFQMFARMFTVTSAATAFVIVTEELPAAHRGWGIGILGALGTFGVGLSALLFAVIDQLPFGWRAMYAAGLVPVVLLPMFRREIRETQRFTRDRDARLRKEGGAGSLAGWWRPFVSLARHHPGRTLAIGVIGAAGSAGHAVAYNFSAYFVQVEHGWAPGQYSLLLLLAGAVGILGHPYAGRVADRRGRRVVGCAFFGVFPLLGVAFYTGPGWSLPLLWIPLVFALTGGLTIARALSTELFPTSSRGTASGWLQLVETLGAAGGLFLVSLATPEGSSVIPAVRVGVFATLLAALAVVFLPETGRRELEEISGETASPPPAAAPAGSPARAEPT